MSFEIIPTPDFSRSLKVLAKRHRSLKQDMSVFISSLKENPLQGTEIAPNIRKVRLTLGWGKGYDIWVVPEVQGTCRCIYVNDYDQ